MYTVHWADFRMLDLHVKCISTIITWLGVPWSWPLCSQQMLNLAIYLNPEYANISAMAITKLFLSVLVIGHKFESRAQEQTQDKGFLFGLGQMISNKGHSPRGLMGNLDTLISTFYCHSLTMKLSHHFQSNFCMGDWVLASLRGPTSPLPWHCPWALAAGW